MFDLEQAIAEWRRQMLAGGIRTPVPLEELENHLREDFEQQMRKGLGAEQAFEAAVQRLGRAKALEAEFDKAVELKEARERKFKLLCTVLVALVYLGPLALSAPKPWSRMDPADQWLGLAAVALTVASMFSGLFLYRYLPIIPDQRVRTRVQFAGAIPLFAWLCVFAYIILPRLELTLAPMTVATLWAISPLAVFGGLICGLDEAARRRLPAVS